MLVTEKTLCTRSACRVELIDETHTAIHKYSKLPYCIRCARLINRANGEAVVTWGASNDNGRKFT